MAQMKQRLGETRRRAARKVTELGGAAPRAEVEALNARVEAMERRGDVAELRRRVVELEAEVQECRQLNLRLAELVDVVQELLLPVASRDEAKLAELVERYERGL